MIKKKKKTDDFESRWAEENALKKLRGNIGLFGKTMFPTALSRDVPPFHYEIYKSLSDESIKRLLIAAPRGTAKSTVTS